MTVANISYFTDLSELWSYVDQAKFMELAASLAAGEVGTNMSVAMQDRITTAINFGRATLDNYLRDLYDVSLACGLVTSVTATTPGPSVKIRNGMIAEWSLASKRMGLEDRMRIWEAIKRDLTQLTKSNAAEILGEGRTSQILPSGNLNQSASLKTGHVSIFDAVPGAPWADPRIVENLP